MKSIRESSAVSAPLAAKIARLLNSVEMVLSGLLILGLLLPKFDIDSSLVILIAVGGLAIVFFLQAYSPLPIPIQKEQPGFKELFAFTVLPKVMWIGASVSTVGVLFFLLDISNGAFEMMTIGATSLAACMLVTGYFYISARHYIIPLIPVLYRVVPVLLITTYILLV
jgi:hypothetical protein